MEAKDLLNSLAEILKKEMAQQLTIAGHKMTGDLIASIESIIFPSKIEIWLNRYGIALDQGVKPEKIPFTEPSGRGGRSLYIEGLQRFAQLKLGITDERESLGIAFAIARAQKKSGMPIAGPTQFIQKTIDATDADIQQFAEDWAEAVFEAQINTIIENIRA